MLQTRCKKALNLDFEFDTSHFSWFFLEILGSNILNFNVYNWGKIISVKTGFVSSRAVALSCQNQLSIQNINWNLPSVNRKCFNRKLNFPYRSYHISSTYWRGKNSLYWIHWFDWCVVTMFNNRNNVQCNCFMSKSCLSNR
jgi:hypothetical protein